MDAKQHKCKSCKKRFERSSDLKRHYKLHTGVKAFTCNVCDKSFFQSGNLLVHKRIHSGDKPYGCSICDKSFTQKSSLVRHKRTHTGETPYVCGKCGKAFSNPYHLVCHSRIHAGLKPYECPKCEKKFSQCGGLIAHKRTHTGEKLFKCNICDKEYTQASGLRKHKETHIGEIFTCNICNKQFSKVSNLAKHKITHSGKYFDCSVHIRDVLPARRLLDRKVTHTGVNLFKFDIQVKVNKESYSDLPNKRAPAPPVSPEQSHQCDLCEQIFASSELLTLHKEFHMDIDVVSHEHHLDKDVEALKESFDNRSHQAAPAMSLEESYKCDLCEKIFASTELLTSHKEVHTEQQMSDEGSLEANEGSLGNSSHQTTPAMSQEELYQCDLCKLIFSSSELLTSHKELHTGHEVGNVSHEQSEHHLQNKLEANKGLLGNQSHQTAPALSQEELYQCDLCIQLFSSSELLTLHNEFHTGHEVGNVSHEQSEHHLQNKLEANKGSLGNSSHQTTPATSQEEFYQCDLCKQIFSSSELLTLHKELHTEHEVGYVPHEQSEHHLQSELEANKGSLSSQSHQKTPAMSQEELYQCDLCIQLCSSSELSTLHKELHTGHEVGNVSQEQSEHHLQNELEANKGSLGNQSHQTTPAMSQEELYQCDLCKQFFSSPELLTLHNELHTGHEVGNVSHEQSEHHLQNELEANKGSLDNSSHQTTPVMSQQELYQCDLCIQLFSSSELLTLHSESHTGQQMSDTVSHEQSEHHLQNELEANKGSFGNQSCQTAPAMSQEELYQCDLCQQIFVSSELLTSHKQFHTGQQMSDVVSQEQLEHHLQNELEANEESFGNRSHQTALGMNQEESYECDLCSRNLASTELLTLHKEIFHTGEQMSDVISHEQLEPHLLDNNLEANKESFGNRSHQTTPAVNQNGFNQHDLCERILASLELLASPKELHTGQEMSDISHEQSEYHLDNNLEPNKESFRSTRDTNPPAMKQEESYQCDLFERIFASTELLTSHKELHTGQQISDHVVSAEQLEHYLLEINKLEPIEEALFNDNRSHQAAPAMSQEESLYQCNLCERTFASSRLLTSHKELHTGQHLSDVVSPEELEHYVLDINKLEPIEEALFNDNRSGHQAATAMSQEESLYQCDLCERVFASSTLLTLHKEFHTGQQTSDVVSHEQLDLYHLDSELEASEPSGITYICADCDEEFELADELFKHSEIHFDG